MSKSKSLKTLATLMALSSSVDYAVYESSSPLLSTKIKSPEELKQLEIEREEQLQLSRGLKKFYYSDDFVFALNQSTANKKAKKRGFINI